MDNATTEEPDMTVNDAIARSNSHNEIVRFETLDPLAVIHDAEAYAQDNDLDIDWICENDGSIDLYAWRDDADDGVHEFRLNLVPDYDEICAWALEGWDGASGPIASFAAWAGDMRAETLKDIAGGISAGLVYEMVYTIDQSVIHQDVFGRLDRVELQGAARTWLAANAEALNEALTESPGAE